MDLLQSNLYFFAYKKLFLQRPVGLHAVKTIYWLIDKNVDPYPSVTDIRFGSMKILQCFYYN